MLIAASIKQLLDRGRIAYRVLQHKRVASLQVAAQLLNIDAQHVLTTQVVADKEGVVLVVYPQHRSFDLSLCKQVLQRDVAVLPNINVNQIFKDCESGSWPAVGHAYGLEVVIDKSIKQLDKVYFASGSHTSLIQMELHDYLLLNPRAKFVAVTTAAAPLSVKVEDERTDLDLTSLLEGVIFSELPPFLKNDTAADLTLTPHGARNVIEHILRFDTVSHVVAGRGLDAQRGADAEEIWNHCCYAACYAKQITTLLSSRLNLDPETSYLAGLLHNFGLLLFSQLFPPEYRLLRKWMQLNPKVSISILEQRLLGMGRAFNVLQGGHTQLGEWLLRQWQMPEVICVIAKEHHSLTYNGEYVHYVKIIQLTNQLLREKGIGDGSLGVDLQVLLQPLGVTLEQVYECTDGLQPDSELQQLPQALTKSSQL